MPSLDVTGAADRLLANKSVAPKGCLEYVSRAIRNGLPPLIWNGLDTALNCWNLACGDKRDSRNVPKGFPAFLGAKRGNNAGDVIISRGDGTFAATDWPTWSVVGICTLEQREAQTGRKYLGYAGEFLGYTLTSTAAAAQDITRITEQEDDMPYPTVRSGDPADQSIAMLTSEALLVSFESLDQYNAARMTGAVSEYYQFPDGLGYRLLAERTARVEARRAASGTVDIDALAQRLAPLLTSPVLAALQTAHGITSDDIEAAVRSVFADAAAK